MTEDPKWVVRSGVRWPRDVWEHIEGLASRRGVRPATIIKEMITAAIAGPSQMEAKVTAMQEEIQRLARAIDSQAMAPPKRRSRG